MSVNFVSTAYLGAAMLPAVHQSQAQLAQLEIESSSGQYADLGEHLGGSSGYELSLRNADDLLQTITTSNAVVSGRLSTTSTALSSLSSSAQTVLQNLASWTPGAASGVDLVSTGDDSLQTLANYGNTSYDGQYVFGGINSGVAPMSSYSSGSASQTALENAFQTQFGFSSTSASAQSITASQMTSFLSGAFAAEFSGTNWTTNWSSASSTDESMQISPGQTAQTSTNLNAGGFQPLAEAYAMLSMFGGSNMSSAAQQSVVTAATDLLSQGVNQLTKLGASVGQSQADIKSADDNMSTQMTLMQTQVGNLDNVDAAKVATQLNTLTTQLETAYQATAQLQKLSLAQYLPT